MNATAENAIVVIPVFTTRHYMLAECVRNVRDTTGVEPVVWECPGNVSVARNQALQGTDTKWVCFLDTDAFPVEKDWLQELVRVAELQDATILQPNEIMDFPGGQVTTMSGKDPIVVPGPRNCATMCLLVNRVACLGLFDEDCGLTAGRLGPCIEDTDFACAVVARGGKVVFHPGIHVLHRDRGAINITEWKQTDEVLCYHFMNTLLEVKWHERNVDIRKGFFRHLGSVPAKDQRHLADGFTAIDLLHCYLPVAADLPGQDSALVAKVLERCLERSPQYQRGFGSQ